MIKFNTVNIHNLYHDLVQDAHLKLQNIWLCQRNQCNMRFMQCMLGKDGFVQCMLSINGFVQCMLGING